MTNSLEFLKQSFKNIRTTGAVVRSSKYLVKEMLLPVNFKKVKVIVELGAGDGVLTTEILAKMPTKSRLLCFEINPEFCKILRGIEDSRFILIEDSAENLHTHMKRLHIKEVDYIISAIPFVALPDELAYSIVEGCEKALKKFGLYVQFHYSPLIKSMYERIFGNVDVNFVALNIPPAFVMICKKK
jgi:phosphatidylethanolamine/phosphatidyl-N-methylethanolamine N-methyltransferase